jgi:hypothetical protein
VISALRNVLAALKEGVGFALGVKGVPKDVEGQFQVSNI